MTAPFTEAQSVRPLSAVLVVFRFLLCHSQRKKKNLEEFVRLFFPAVHQGFGSLFMFILRTRNTLKQRNYF